LSATCTKPLLSSFPNFKPALETAWILFVYNTFVVLNKISPLKVAYWVELKFNNSCDALWNINLLPPRELVPVIIKSCP